jgi:peptidoglycan/LPS O-acetylase OafA/YrhL
VIVLDQHGRGLTSRWGWNTEPFSYVPALDGIRAGAVIAVLCVHGDTPLVGGFIGVDIFFVLSGFLITTLLVQEAARTGSIAWLAFYLRRARRLLPALAATLILVALLTIAVSTYNLGISYWKQLVAVVAYSGNWVDAFGTFGKQGPLGPLTHTWSLAIEEQFYLLWPALLVFLLRSRLQPLGIASIALVISALSFADRAVSWTFGSAGPYYRSDTRADGLLLGCALAIVLCTTGGRGLVGRATCKNIAASIAIIAILVVGFTATIESGWLYVVGLSLVNVSAAILIAHTVLARRSLWSRFLSIKPLTWVGERSYGLYLYHVPIFLLLSSQRLGIAPKAAFALQLFVTFAVAAASYRWIELPFLHKRRATQPTAPQPRPRSSRDTEPAVVDSLGA